MKTTKTELPSWDCYCDNTTDVNALVFDLEGIRVWFSYKTPVAFEAGAGPLLVRKNAWGPTTGKHLNAIDGGQKKTRISGMEFERLLAGALNQ